MAKREGSKTVVVGGKHDITQQYCGTVGGQSTDFSALDTDVKVRPLFLYFLLVDSWMCSDVVHCRPLILRTILWLRPICESSITRIERIYRCCVIVDWSMVSLE